MTTTIDRYITLERDAYNEIKSLYDIDTLRDIAMNGCASGCASYHIYTSDCVDFYNNHQDEIDEYICDALGVDSILELDNIRDAGDLRHAANLACWTYIELVAGVLADEADCE